MSHIVAIVPMSVQDYTQNQASNRSEKQPKFRNKGFLRAYYAEALAATPASLAGTGILSAMKKVSKLSESDSLQLSQAAQQGLKKTGLFDKGVRIHQFEEVNLKDLLKKTIQQVKNLSKGNLEDVTNLANPLGNLFTFTEKDKEALGAIKEEVLSNKKFAKLTKNNSLSKMMDFDLADFVAQKLSLPFKTGSNACFLPHANKIITPDKSLQTSVFHEMGHALNHNGGVLLKGLQACRPIAKIVPGAVLLISLLNKRKTTDEQNQNDSKVQRGADFVKRNAGKITLAAFFPMVAEEGLASLRGQVVAKKLVQSGDLTKELFKKIKLTNLGGFASYSIAAVGTALAIKFGIKVKDKIQAKYETKKMEKFEAKQAKILAKSMAA